MKNIRSILFILIICMLGSPELRADSVILKTGAEFKGMILEQTEEQIKIRIGLGVVTYKMDLVGSIKEEPADIDHFRLGESYLKLGDYNKAREEYNQVLRLNPDHDLARQGLKTVEAKVEQARERTRQKRTKLVEYYKKGLEAINKKKYKNAISYLEKARKISPSQQKIGRALAAAYKRFAQEYMDKESFVKAFKLLKKARAVTSGDKKVNSMLVVVFNKLGQASFDKGYFNKVIKMSSQALKLEPNNIIAHTLLGRAYYETEQIQEAASEFKIVLKIDPDNEEIKKLLNAANLEKVTVKEMGLWKSDYFIIDFDFEDEQQKELIRDVLITLEDAYKDIGSDLLYYPDAKTEVTMYSREEYLKLKDMPEWSAGVYSPKTKEIIISLLDLEKQPKEQIKTTLRHETTHLFVDHFTKGNCPLWLNEGFAKYQENKNRENKTNWQVLEQAVKKDKFYTLKDLESSLIGIKDKKKIALSYLQFKAAVEYIISKYDLRGLRKIFKELGQGRAINEALIIATKFDYNDLEKKYKDYLKKEHSPKIKTGGS